MGVPEYIWARHMTYKAGYCYKNLVLAPTKTWSPMVFGPLSPVDLANRTNNNRTYRSE